MKKTSTIQNELKVISIYVAITVIFIFGLASYNIYHANQMHQISSTIYEHPLQVSNAALKVQMDVVRIHRDMKDVVLATSDNEINKLVENISIIESRVNENFKVIEENILGIQGLELQKQTKELFTAWKPIRSEVINLVKKEDLKAAIHITKNKGAKHVEKVEAHALILYQYAKNKADLFNEKSYFVLEDFKKLNILITLLFILVFTAMVFYIINRIKRFIKKTEESEHRFELLYDKAPLPYQSLGSKGNILIVNEKWLEELGYSKKEEVVGKNFAHFLTPSYKKKFAERFPKFKTKGDTSGVEFEMVKKNGEIIIVSFNGKIVYDDNGEFLRTHCIFSNITDSKKVQEELYFANIIVENSNIILFRWKAETGWPIEYVSNNIKQLGFSAKKLLDDKVKFSDIMHPDDLQMVINEGERYRENKTTNYSIEYRIISPDKSIHWVEERSNTEYDSEGNIAYYQGTILDITKRKKIEKERSIFVNHLKKQKELIDRQSKNAKIGYWIIDVNTNNIRWSSEILKMYGLEKEPENNNLFTLKQSVHPHDINKLVKSLEKAKLDASYKHDMIYRIVRNDITKWVHCQGKLNVDENRVEGTLQDITELKNTQLELDQKKEILVAQSKSAMMGDMISMIVHQFKQPLSVLSMLASNQKVSVDLGENITNEKILEDANMIDKEVIYLSDTMDTFRNFLMPDTQKIEEEIDNVIESSLHIINKSLINNNVKLFKEYKSDQKISIIHSELMQVFINLLNNSKDAFKINNIEDRKIWIRTYDKNSNVIVEIEDTAGGIESDVLDQVFDAYFTTKEEYGGTGVGLYIVHVIITEHLNGTINVQNTNSGVKFIINIPSIIK